MFKFQYQNSTKWLCHQWLELNLLKPTPFLGIIPKASQTKFHQIPITKSKVIHVQIPVPKWKKTKTYEKIFWATKRGNKAIAKLGQVLGTTNRNNRYYKKELKLGQGLQMITRDYKGLQPLQIKVNNTNKIFLQFCSSLRDTLKTYYFF